MALFHCRELFIFDLLRTPFRIFFLIALPLGLVVSVNANTFLVTKTIDTNDGVCDADCSLREAIAAADAGPTDDVIEFSSFVVGIGVIPLTRGELVVHGNGSLTINGSDPVFFSISGNFQGRIFAVESSAVLRLNTLTVREGNPSDGTWYRQNSSDGSYAAFQFGASGDKPTQTAFRY